MKPNYKHMAIIIFALMMVSYINPEVFASEVASKKDDTSLTIQAERLLSLLRQQGIHLYDWTVSIDEIQSLEQLKEGLKAFEGRSFEQIPSDNAIINQLTNLLEKVRAMNTKLCIVVRH